MSSDFTLHWQLRQSSLYPFLMPLDLISTLYSTLTPFVGTEWVRYTQLTQSARNPVLLASHHAHFSGISAFPSPHTTYVSREINMFISLDKQTHNKYIHKSKHIYFYIAHHSIPKRDHIL
jgi:hypothetical protein